MKQADLNAADLNAAELIGANLTGTDLTGADLIGADLTGTDLRGTNLKKARYNSKKILLKNAQGKPVLEEPTQWPSSFDFKASGATCVDCLEVDAFAGAVREVALDQARTMRIQWAKCSQTPVILASQAQALGYL